MLKSIIVSLAKRYAIKAVNGLLSKHRDNVAEITGQIDKWTLRLTAISNELQKINNRVSDAVLTDEEVKQTTDELNLLIRDF